MKDKEQPVERPAPRPPIYSVAVVEVACRALEAMAAIAAARVVLEGTPLEVIGDEICGCAFRVIHDGLIGHEKAIKGEP